MAVENRKMKDQPQTAVKRSLRQQALALGILASLASAVPARSGTVVCAGTGPLGDGTAVSSYTPVRVRNLSGVISIGLLPMMAVKSDGTVWSWGCDVNDPVRIEGLEDVVSVKGSELAFVDKLALKSDGTVWKWSEEDPVPAPVPDPADPTGFLTQVTQIANGSLSHYALKNDGTVWAWGTNYDNRFIYGLLGDGTTIDRPTPVQCLGLSGVKAIAADRTHAMALKSDGTVWAWGGNSSGQLGDGTYTARVAPVRVFPSGGASGPGAAAVAVAASAYTSHVLRADGTVWGCGRNIEGELGDGTTDSKNSWVRVAELNDVSAIASGPNAWNGIAVKSDGSAWGWGLNDHGDLGCGTNAGVQPLCRVRSVAPEAGDLSGEAAAAGSGSGDDPGRLDPLAVPEEESDSAAFLGGVIAAATDVDRSCFLTTHAPMQVPSIAMAQASIRGKAVAAATVTVSDEFGVPVAGATVCGSWTGSTTSESCGATGSDGTVTFFSTAFRGAGETCTFTVDTVKKSGMFLDRWGSVLGNSIAFVR